MVYDIELIRRIDRQAEALALEICRLVADGLNAVVAEAKELLPKIETVPTPDGFRIRVNECEVVYEFPEPQGS